jgi:hypothetical protein
VEKITPVAWELGGNASPTAKQVITEGQLTPFMKPDSVMIVCRLQVDPPSVVSAAARPETP